MSKKVAIFGGTFDPLHIGHTKIIKKSLKKLNIDQVIVVPTYLNPFKNRFFLKPKNRLAIIKKSFKKVKNVKICNYEVKQNRAVTSIETVKYLINKKSFKKVYFIIGEDNLKTLHKWDSFEELNNLVEFVVVTRNNMNSKHNYKTIKLDIKISSTELRNKLNKKFIPKNIIKNIKKFYKNRKIYE